jgi:hypothetical protein
MLASQHQSKQAPTSSETAETDVAKTRRRAEKEGDYKLMMTAWEIFPNTSFTQSKNLIEINLVRFLSIAFLAVLKKLVKSPGLIAWAFCVLLFLMSTHDLIIGRIFLIPFFLI